MLFAFSSQQVVSVFPMMFESGKDILYGKTDLSTLFGGAATTLLDKMVQMGLNNTLNATSSGWDWEGIDLNPFND
jgi:hypothetical protein